MGDFDELFERMKRYYVHHNGLAKFEKVEEKITNSEKFKKLNEESIQRRAAPSETDFSIRLHEMSYFIFASAETTAMGGMIAIRNWNNVANRNNSICPKENVFLKGDNMMNRYQMKYKVGF